MDKQIAETQAKSESGLDSWAYDHACQARAQKEIAA